MRLLLYGKCFEISLANLNFTVISLSLYTKVGKDEMSIFIFVSEKVNAYVFFHLPGQFLNEDSLSKVQLWTVVLLPEVVKLTYTFTFKVEVTVGKKLWIELTYEILRQVAFL